MPSHKSNILNKVIRLTLLVTAVFGLAFHIEQDNTFKNSQTKYKTVKTAYQKKWTELEKLLKEKGIDSKDFQIHIRAFKYEKQLEVWGRSKGVGKYTLIKTIPICASSGELGPKRKQGDGQVPEGFYEVSWFNPMSDYHLGLKINYPNAADRKKATGRDPGGDIMIHGNCVTIGCIPLQDEPIEELFVLCVESKNNKHDIGVSIYPFKMTIQNFETVKNKEADKEKIKFWESLKTVYQYFEDNSQMPKVKVSKEGEYQI